jgi:hypothetical protein
MPAMRITGPEKNIPSMVCSSAKVSRMPLSDENGTSLGLNAMFCKKKIVDKNFRGCGERYEAP